MIGSYSHQESRVSVKSDLLGPNVQFLNAIWYTERNDANISVIFFWTKLMLEKLKNAWHQFTLWDNFVYVYLSVQRCGLSLHGYSVDHDIGYL